jgi:hypothetical protein
MAKRKSRHRVSRKLKRHHSRRARRHHRKSHRRHHRGGVAPVNYSLSGNWSSKMSMGQGGDYLKYHVGQHGGVAPFPGSVAGSMLPQNLRQAAHIGGIDKAMDDIKGLHDSNQTGGRRKHKRHSRKHRSRKHRSRKHSKRHRRRGGADLGFAPFPNKGMLLDSSMDYSRAGLNPTWKDVEVNDANIRQGQ